MPVSLPARFAEAIDSLVAFRPGDAVGVAVSGGGDSMALLDLCLNWAAKRKVEIRAVTVNHGLRPEAAGEAEMVAAFCLSRGVRHDTLQWTDWDGTGNLQSQAREARRQLILDWAGEQKLRAVLMGHTADDQAETVLMRLARGSGVDGLAGMPACTDGVVPFLRPLLGMGRQDLRDHLVAQGIAWVDDPSNDDEAFDRVRARKMMVALGELGLTRDRLVQTAEHMQAAQKVLKAAAIRRAREDVTTDRGDLVLGRSLLDLGASDTEPRLLAAALAWVGGGGAYKPRFSSLKETADAVLGGQNRTISGVLVAPQADGRIRLSRELAAVSNEIVPISPSDMPSEGFAWDKRWRLRPLSTLPANAKGLEIRSLGEGVLNCPDWRASGQPRSSLMATPAIWRDNRLESAPMAGFSNGWQAIIAQDFVTWLVSH